MKLYTNRYIDTKIKYIIKRDFSENLYFKYHYVMSYIRLFQFRDKRFTKETYVPLNITILRRIVGRNNASVIINNLLNHGLISCDEIYFFGKEVNKSKGYKWTAECYEEKLYKKKCTDLKLIFKVDSVFKKFTADIIERGDAYSYVTQCMENLTIDKEKSFRYIRDYVNDEDKIESYRISTDIFEDKFAVVDKTSQRLHNNLTNLYSPLRKFLKYNGCQINHCDIRNSQLVFLYIMMKDYYIPKEELNHFGKVVCELGFYEFFAEKMGESLTEENRKEFKTFIFKDILFGKNRKTYNKIEEVFYKTFPNIFYVLRSLKSIEHNKLAIALQKAESSFIFNCVEKLGREIPLLTIHDSIGTTAGNEETVKKLLEQEFLNICGMVPKIKIEKFGN